MEKNARRRQLAAIVFTDIAGYTALMQQDEDLALRAVKKHRQVLEAEIPAHEGEIYQFYGDGCMSIFSSATQAIQCAYACQLAFLQDPQVPVRIGLHIGEIYTEDGKIYGEGVNLASRIESIAQPGTIFFSRDVFEKIRNHRELHIRRVGRYEFKNVEEPVSVYALVNPGLSPPDSRNIRGKLKSEESKRPANVRWAVVTTVALAFFTVLGIQLYSHSQYIQQENAWQMKKSIAVLPFNSIGEGQDASFSYGMAEDIITQLAKISGLKVISRASSSRYADTKEEISTIARELGVQTILLGSVRMQGSKARISIQLIDPVNNTYLWAEDYDRELEDILIVQRDVAMAVAQALKVTLSPEVRTRLESMEDMDPLAYQKYLEGQRILKSSSGTDEELERAIRLFKEAIAIEPNCILAHIGLTDVYLDYLFWHQADDEQVIPKAREAALNALKIDPTLGECYGVLGAIDMYTNQIHSAEENLEKAIRLSPNYSFAYERLAFIRFFQGEEEEFDMLMKKALELDPLSTRLIGSAGYAYYLRHKYDEGIKWLHAYLKQFPDDNYLLWTLANFHVAKGEYETAIDILRQRTVGSETNWLLGYAYARSGQTKEAREILTYHLRKQEEEYVPDFMIAIQYAGLGEPEKALEYLEKGFAKGSEAMLVWGIDTDPKLSTLRDDPRFRRIVRSLKADFK